MNKRKTDRLELRLSPELMADLQKSLKGYGWTMAAVTRTLLEKWANGEIALSGADVGASQVRAPRSKRQRRNPVLGKVAR